ncbi:MAG: alpha/beta hydrolase [Phycisphaerales bacterium]|nr:MAG: alpha/beta hydrolase [Phycisphaerales bacterium]
MVEMIGAAFWGNLLGLSILLGIGLAIAAGVTTLYVAHRLQRPPRRGYAAAVARSMPTDPSELDTPLAYEAWALRSGRHALPAWTIRGLDPAGPVAICAHGWGDGRIGALVRVPTLAQKCAQVIAFDMPGQGEAAGVCDLGTREHAHVRAALESVEPGCDAVLVGWSLGAGACLRLAGELATSGDHAPRLLGVVVEAPYRRPITPARNVMALAGLPHRVPLPIALAGINLFKRGELSARRFDRAAWAARVRVPVLVLHGSQDEVCPIEDARAIAEAAPQGRLAEIHGGHHNDLWTDPDLRALSEAAVRDFLDALRAGTPGSRVPTIPA